MRFLSAVVLLSFWAAAPAVAEPAPPPGPEVPVPPDNGVVASGPAGVAEIAEGGTLTVAALNETQLPVPPLTTSLSSRDWLVGGTFTGMTTGLPGGTLEVGYQIGCGVEMNQIRLGGTVGGGISASSVTVPISGAIDVRMRPGAVTTAVVMTQPFKGDSTRVIVKDIHVHVDGCVGKSNLRSYAVLTTSTPHTEDVVAYYGVPKVF